MPLTAALAGDLPVLLDTLASVSVALATGVRRPLAEPAREVSIAVGADAVTLAAPAWRAIEAAGGAATAFQTLAVAEAMARAHHRRGETPRVVVVRDAGRPVVVFPTVVTRWSGAPAIRFLGDPLIQYGDVVAAPGVSQDHLETAWQAAIDPAVAAFAFLRKVRADARLAPLLVHRTAVVAGQEAPHADTARPYEAINPRELRRYHRRLQERGELRFAVLEGRDMLAAVREAVAMKQAWLAERGLASGVIGDPEWEEALAAVAVQDASPLRVARLSVGGETAAAEIGFVHEGRWCAFLGATSPAFARFGPGHVQMAETIAHCRDLGIATYDLLAPGDAYKSKIAHDSTVVRDHAVALSPAGWASLFAARSIPGFKRLAARMPAGLVRALMVLRPG